MTTPNTPEKRRFVDADRKPWTTEERAAYEKRRAQLAPIIRDLTTPAKDATPKEKDFLEELFAED